MIYRSIYHTYTGAGTYTNSASSVPAESYISENAESQTDFSLSNRKNLISLYKKEQKHQLNNKWSFRFTVLLYCLYTFRQRHMAETKDKVITSETSLFVIINTWPELVAAIFSYAL